MQWGTSGRDYTSRNDASFRDAGFAVLVEISYTQPVKGCDADGYPRRAASMAATSIFFIVIIASNARLAAARSGLV